MLPAPYDSLRHDSSSPGARCRLVLNTKHHGQKSLHLLLVNLSTVIGIISRSVQLYTPHQILLVLTLEMPRSACPQCFERRWACSPWQTLESPHIHYRQSQGSWKGILIKITFLCFHHSYLKRVSRKSFEAIPGGKNLLNWLKLIKHISSKLMNYPSLVKHCRYIYILYIPPIG